MIHYQRRDSGKPKLLHESILQRQIRALHAAFRLARIRANDVDVELVQRPAKLRHAVAADRSRLVHSERRMLVRIESDRLAVTLQICARREKIIERRFRLDKSQVHQSTCRVVDKDESGALRATILEPPVLGPVDLNELADAIAAMSGLVDWLETPPAVLPDPFGQHPAPHGFDAQTQPVTLSQLLGRQRRAKIRVIRLDQRQGRLGMSDISNGEDGDLSNEGLQTRFA